MGTLKHVLFIAEGVIQEVSRVCLIIALEMTDEFLDTVELLAWSTRVVGAANDRKAKGSIHVFCCWLAWFVW